MATLSGVNYAKEISVPIEKATPGEINCRVKFIYEKYVYSATVDVDDVIYGPKIPSKAFIVDGFVKATTGGGTGIYTLGHLAGDSLSASSDGFIDEADAGAGAVLQKMDVSDTKLYAQLSESVRLALTCTEATTNDAGTIEFGLWYTLES